MHPSLNSGKSDRLLDEAAVAALARQHAGLWRTAPMLELGIQTCTQRPALDHAADLAIEPSFLTDEAAVERVHLNHYRPLALTAR